MGKQERVPGEKNPKVSSEEKLARPQEKPRHPGGGGHIQPGERSPGREGREARGGSRVLTGKINVSGRETVICPED